MTIKFRIVCLLVVLTLASASVDAFAQSYPYNVDTRPPRGIMPTSDQLANPIDSIDNTTGKLHLEIPLASLPPGNAGSGFDLSLMYDSNLYDIKPVENTFYIEQQLTNQFSTGGWNYNFENFRVEMEVRFVPSWALDCNSSALSYQEHERLYRFRIGLPDGSLHTLHLRGFEDPNETFYWADGFYGINMDGKRSPCAAEAPNRYPSNVTGTLVYYTTDGSYLRLEIPADGSSWYTKQWTLYFPNGRRVVGMGDQVLAIYDANTFSGHSNPVDATGGNRIYFQRSGGSQPVVTIRDDYGREIVIEKYYTSNPRQDRITTLGPNGVMEWRVNWTTFHIGNSQNPSYSCYYDVQNNVDYYCLWNADHTVVQYIQLPLEKAANPAASFTTPPTPWNSYEFQYSVNGPQHGAGELNYMRMPTGAEYRYSSSGLTYQQRDITQDGVTYTWKWEYAGLNKVRATAPDGGQTTHWFYEPGNINAWNRGLTYRLEQPNGRVIKRQWTRNKVAALADEANKDPNNPYVEKESVTESGQRSAVTESVYDKNGNLLSRTERDWGAANGSVELVETGGPILRRTDSVYHVAVPASTDISEGSQKYWQSGSPLRLDAVRRRTVSDGSTVKAATEFEYDDPYRNGNVRFERQWDSTRAASVPGLGQLTPENSVVFERKYDPSGNGNLVEILEPAVATRLSYSDTPYPHRIEYALGTPEYRSTQYAWNVDAGSLTSQTDIENAFTTGYKYDLLGRRTVVAEGGLACAASLRCIQTSFDDANRTVTVKSDLVSPGDGQLQTVTHYDRLGRVDLVRGSDGAPLTPNGADGVHVRTSYRMRPGGLHVVQSAPFRNPADASLEWTCTQHDQSGRVVASAMFKGPGEPDDCQSAANRTAIALTAYDVASGMARTRSTDPAGKMSDRYADGLGRLAQVTEDPGVLGYLTTYTYDALDNLTRVTPAGGEQPARVFTYTSLGRMASALNPESGTIQYTYTDSGDLKTRSDDRTNGSQRVTLTFNYDALHRTVAKTYSNDNDSTPDVTYQYYTSAPNVGRLLSATSSTASSTYSGYDGLGRVLGYSQTIAGGGTFGFAYSYWLNDAVRSMQYPSGKTVFSDVDGAGRPSKVYRSGAAYADLTGITTPYTPDGRVAKLKLGNNLWETRDYQAPGAATALRLGTSEGGGDKLELLFNFSPTANNGNLLSQVVRQGANFWSQTYGYDALNRLSCASENTTATPAVNCAAQNSWWQMFGYDRFGNRWLSGSGGFTLDDVHEFTTEGTIHKATNRLNGSGYDAAGNLTSYTPYTMDYDAENRMLSMTSSSNGNSTFAYDSEGRRLKKVTTIGTPQTTYFVYDAAGRLAAEYSTQAAPSGTSYLFADLLGTVRAVTSNNGTVVECSDYSPYGRLLQTSSRSLPCHQTPSRAAQQFTGQVRDTETKLDYFGARYLSAGQGRFLSPDPKQFSARTVANPQGWNRYEYALDNPLKYIDPDGKDAIAAFFLGERYRDVSTFDAVFGKETLSDLKRAWGTFLEDHRQLTYGLSPFPTTKTDLGIQMVLPVGGKVLDRAVAKALSSLDFHSAGKQLTKSGENWRAAPF